MQKSEVNSAALLAAAIAAALALKLTPNSIDLITGLGGLTLLLVLFSFDRDGYRTVLQSLAYAAVCGFCLVILAGAIFQEVATNQDPHSVQTRLVATWLFGTVILWAIDRARMSGRTEDDSPIRTSQRTLLAEPYAPPVPVYAPPAPPAPVYAPPVAAAPVYSAPPPAQSAPAYAPPPAPAYAPPPPAPAVAAAPENTAPIMNAIAYAATVQPEAPPPQPAPVPTMQAAAMQAPAATQMFASQPLQQAASAYSAPVSMPAPIAIPPGREATVYVSLVGEGIACLRSVRAEHLGRDYYKIVEPMPEGETWEYQPGQVVRCKKKNLSNGKALVAFEEAQRA